MANDSDRLSHWAASLLNRMQYRNSVLHAQSDATKEGIKNGGLLFWTDPPGKVVGAAAAKELIEKGKVVPLNDGLFDTTDQTWRCA